MNKYSFLLCCLLLILNTACQKGLQQISSPSENKAVHLEKPYVILISLDGYRYDYNKRFQPPHLSKFAAEGVQATSMLPCFPSKTFPNHYSIATGMRPENHGLVNNTFYDPKKDAIYKMSDREKVEDGTWYGGTPIWVQAAKSGMLSASYFFVGSEADVQGVRPNYWYRYDGSIPNKDRTKQVIDWLNLPPAKRPHLIMMYFSDVDSKGHRFGPNNAEQLKASIFALDEVLGNFFQDLEKLDLPINVIIVSDHGMEEVPIENYIEIERLEDDSLYKTVNNGALAHFYLNDKNKLEEVYQNLKAKETRFRIYKTSESPYYKTNPTHPRLGDLIAVVDHHYYFADARRIALRKRVGRTINGEHGFPVNNKDVHAIFYARGPQMKSKMLTPSFENIHVYPLICEILGIKIPKDIDGSINVLADILIK
ncbi:MAG: ectonucleotide pyrophosphatase/phosphodiesterase [Bacteroidota bacterium]